MHELYAQGDLLIERVSDLEAVPSAMPLGTTSVVLAEGERTDLGAGLHRVAAR